MHILTKIFVVLVTLLAVLLVPLVVVYAHNENSYRSLYQQEQLAAAEARTARDAAERRLAAETTRNVADEEKIAMQNTQLQRQISDMLAEKRNLESQLVEAASARAKLDSQFQALVSTQQANQELTENLVGELQDLRNGLLASEKEKIEIDEAYREVVAQLQEAEEARRALSEEVQRLTRNNGEAMKTIQMYVQRHGSLPEANAGAIDGGFTPTRDLTATVIDVRRSDMNTLVEIDAGSRDGVEVDWEMTISSGPTFIANLRIIEVDVNTAIGVVSLEDASARGSVQIGQTVMSGLGR